jgi:hypothetical protein
MSDLKELLNREAGLVDAAPDALEVVLRRRDRKRRNQQIVAGVVGIAVFVAAIWIVTSVGALDRSETSVVPGGDANGPDATMGAVDEGFRGRYLVIGHQIDGPCQSGGFENRVRVRYISQGVRYLARAGLVWNGRLRFMPGERFPWQTNDDDPFWFELRYNPATDSAVGYRHGLQDCEWRVRFVRLGST